MKKIFAFAVFALSAFSALAGIDLQHVGEKAMIGDVDAQKDLADYYDTGVGI